MPTSATSRSRRRCRRNSSRRRTDERSAATSAPDFHAREQRSNLDAEHSRIEVFNRRERPKIQAFARKKQI